MKTSISRILLIAIALCQSSSLLAAAPAPRAWKWDLAPQKLEIVQRLDAHLYSFRDEDRKLGMIEFDPSGENSSGGRVVSPSRYDEIMDFVGEIAAFRRGKLWGFVDRSGHEVIPPRYDDTPEFLPSERFPRHPERAILVSRARKHGWIDSTGREIVAPRYDEIGDSVDGHRAFTVRAGRVWLLVNVQNGRVIATIRSPHQPFFYEGLARIRRGGKIGFIDLQGREVLPPQFDDSSDFSQGLAAVKRGRLWGYIDPSGQTVIPFQYDFAREFYDTNLGLAVVQRGGKWGAIDRTGREVIAPQYDQYFIFDHGRGMVKLDGERYSISVSGERSPYVPEPQRAYGRDGELRDQEVASLKAMGFDDVRSALPSRVYPDACTPAYYLVTTAEGQRGVIELAPSAWDEFNGLPCSI